MNTTQTIQMLIDQAKKAPNSLLRNKLVSRLEDAKIVSQLIDHETGAQLGVQPTAIPLPSQQSTGGTTTGCTCIVGARDVNCPFHR